ncbi:MAG: gliding motility-associated C-terminal domain-containing protein [Lutibacter sp.]|uniref:PKD-like domain-containing protein n=1 Tax=Lutibacter sp. TaxID=1925666 RepID=UPI00385F8F1C
MYKNTFLSIRRVISLVIILLISTTLFSNSFENNSENKVITAVDADNPTFSPNTGHAGTIVTINDLAGTFTAIPLSTVTLNGVPISPSDITFISSTELTVIIPCGSTSGPFIVDGGLPSVLDFNYIAPSVDALVDQTYCVNETAFPIALSGQPTPPTDGVLEFLWSSSNASIGLINANPTVGVTAIPTFTPLNTTTEPISSIITVIPTINGCPGPSTSYTITVNPRPIANSIASIVVCAGELVPPITLTASSPFSGTGSSFTWSGDNNVAIGLGTLSGSTSPIPQFTATNTTGSTITSTFTVTPTFQGCDGIPITFTIDVLPDNFAGTLTFDICSGDTFTQTLTSSIPGNIDWFRAAVPGILEGTSSGTNIINEVLTNTTSTTISVTYDLTLPSGPTCNDTQFIVVNVAPRPSDATIITGGPQLVCAGDSGNVYNTAVIPNATSYVWTLPDGSNVTTPTNSISISYAVTDTSGNLTVHGENSCGIGGESANYPITIIAQPTLLSSVTPPNICSEDIFNYTPVSSTFGASLSWTRAIQPGISNPPGIGNDDITESLINATNATLPVVYTYTLTTTDGCVNTQDITVLVDPLPQLTSPTAPTAVCSGSLFNIPLISDVAGTVSWSRVVFPGIAEASSSGSDFINETLTNTTNATISVPYTITLPTSTAGCDAAVITIFVDVEPLPFDAVTITSGPQTVCAGSSGNVYITDVLPNATTYEWTLPNGSIVATNFPTITISYALSETSGNLSVHGVNSCGNGGESANYSITIIAPPTLSSSLTPPPVCSGEPFIYFPTSTPAGATYTWTRALQLDISNPAGAGTNDINEILYNLTSSPIPVDYVYTITTPEGCQNTEIVTVIVNPLPILTNPPILPSEVCSGTLFDYTPISNPIGTINWSRNAIVDILNPSASGSGTISEVLINTSSSPVTVTYELTLPATTAGCTNTVSFIVVVNPVPSDATTIVNGPQTVCAGSTGNIYNANPIPNATSYLWTLPNGSTNTTTTSQITINYTLSNVSGNLTVQGVNSCGVGAVSASYPITVLAPPILTSPTSLPDICSGDTFTYNPTSSSPNINFSWIRNLQFGIANAPGVGTDGISETLINTLTIPISVEYIYTMTTPTPELCENTEIVTVIVNPLPTLTSSTALAPVCSGTSFTIPLTSSEPGLISWNRNTISGILEGSNSGSGNITETLTNLTNTTVSVTYEITLPNTANGCSDIVYITIDIEAIPSDAGSINSSGPQLVCAGANGNVYTVAAITNATSYAWTLPNGSINTTTTNSITINYGLTDVSGNLSVHGVNSCGIGGESANYPITIIAPPTLSSGLTPPDVCSEQLFTYTPTSISTGATFSWTRAIQSGISNSAGSGNDGISEILVNTTNVPVGVDYIYTINTSEGCENIETVTIFVNPLPQLTSSTVTTEICSGDTFTYTPASTTDPTTINWTRVPAAGILGAASGTGNISDVLINSTGLPILVTYELDLTPTGQGCTDTVTISVIVNPLPTASISGGGSTCLNSTDNLIIFTGANGTAPFTFTYNIDGSGPYFITTTSGNSIAIPSSSSTVGTFLYDLINVQDSSTTSCSNPQTGSATITVNSLPILIITNPTPVCEIDTVDLTVGAITAGSDAGLAFSYFTDATATTQYLTPTAATEGTYYIMATNTNGCSVIKPVIVTTNPIPTVTVSNVTVCEGDLATISAIPNPPGAYDYNWTNLPVGVPNPGNVASFTTSIAGDYTVDVTNQILPNCVSLTATGTVTLNPLPDATITGSASTICVDDVATISFTGSLGTVPYTFAYNINGGTTQTVLSAGTTATINVNTSVSGNFNFNLLSVTDSSITACTQTLTGLSYAIEVLPPPSLTISNPAPICAGDTVDLQTTITPFDSGLTYTYWANIGATIPLSTPNAVNEGTYFIKATNSTGCSSIAEVVVTALALPTVTINSETICEGDTATITATPTITGSYNYNWSVPSGATNPGNVSTFTTSVAGNYTVFITDQNTPYCESTTATGTVTINPLPTATISSSATEVCLNTPVTITFTGATGTAPYTFEYIDESGATQTIVSTLDIATFTVPTNTSGIYNYTLVSVTDSSATSCTQIQSGTASITVRDLPIVDAGPSTLEVCAGEEITLSGSGATTYIWNNGVTDGVPFTPIITGTYTVIGTDSFGCENTDDIIITVLPAITGTITGTYDYTLCEGATPPIITFEGANGTGGYTFYYTISSSLLPIDVTGSITTSGNTADLTPPIPTTTPGEFLVTLNSVDSGTCSNGQILEPSQAFVTILEAGIVPLNLIDVNQLICEGDPIIDIVFDINGSPTDAFVEGLPTDVLSEYIPSATLGIPGTLTISGIASSAGTFNYIVKTSGAIIGCNSEFTGIIEVNPIGKLSLSIPDSDVQDVCINTAITPITYNLEGSANGAAVIFLPYTPTGITWSVTSTTVTISGIPTEAGDFTYTVETFSTTTSCEQTTTNGSLTINSSEITLLSGDPDPVLCINTPLIDTINYNIINNPNIIIPGATLILIGLLPEGITFDSITGIIDGTPTEAGIFPYTIEASTGCGNILSGTITVNDALPNVEIEGGLQEIEVCIGSEITLTATGADNYEWYLSVDLDASGSPIAPPRSTSDTFTITPTENGSYFVIGSLNAGCDNMAEINILLKQAITATIEGNNVYEVCKDTNEPSITFKGSNGTAPYIFTYSIGTIISTVTSPATSDSVIINIPTNVAGIYNIQLINVEDSGSLYCNPPLLLEPTTAVVTVLDSGVYPQAGTSTYQTICEGDAITPITFDITGDATNAYAEGLPSGVTSSFVGNVLTISGTPTVSFDYTVVTSGLIAECNSSFTGTITVNPNDTITALNPSNEPQEICACTSIEPILYELGGGATGATVTGLPSGITWSIVDNIVTIEGNSCDTPNTYTYTITTQGICSSATEEGDITILDPDSLQLTIGEANTTICVNVALAPNIQYQSSPGQTLILIGTLPPGVNFTNDVVTGSGIIQGTPTLSGVYNYSILTGNNCSTELSGSITVEDGPFINSISGELNQISCLNSAIEPIRFAVPSSLTDVTFSPTLPTGISYLISDGELIISGTPTVITSNPNIITISTDIICNDFATAEIELTIEDIPTIILESSSGLVTQSVCQNSEIDPIIFTVNPIGTEIDETLLPSFITVNFDSVTGTYVLTGAPVNTGTFNFQIQTLSSLNCSAELDITIENLYAAVTIELDSGSDSQTLCSFTNPIEDIVYNITGSLPSAGIISVSGLPSGVSASQITSSTGLVLTISGQPSESGIFEYEIIYDNCGTIKKGVLEISSPMSISGEVTQISCDGNDGEITVTIFGGVPFIDENGNPLYAITWEGPNGFRQNQNTITGLAPGDYTFSGTDAIGCPLPTEVFTINSNESIAISLLSITNESCNSPCVNFDFAGGSGIYTSFLLENYNSSSQSWNEVLGVTNYFNICDLQIGLYRLSVTDSNNCVSEPYSFTIDSEQSLSIDYVNIDENLCSNASGTITVKMNSLDTDLTFYYNDVLVSSTNVGSNIYELVISTSGLNGILKVVNSQGCSDEVILSTNTVEDIDFEFTSLDFASVGYIGVNSSIEFTNLLDINIFNNIDYNYIVWDFDDNTPFKVFYNPEDLAYNSDGENINTVFHTYTNDGIYEVTLTVFNSAGCSKSITKTIIIGKGATIILPTVFSPNYDGINDLFGPSFNGIKEITMYIYDVWGNLVYEATNKDITSENNLGELRWDGIEPVNSEPKNTSYRCYIIAKTLDGKTIEKTGRFLIVQ